MKSRKGFMKGKLLLFIFLVTLVAVATVVEQTPGVPNLFNTTESQYQQQTHFLVFTGKDTAGESVTTSTAYYNAIDPTSSKRNFTQWLKNAGFISDESQWNPSGPQIIACDLGPAAGCDQPAHNPDGSLNYGPNIINTDSHAIVLNAADLGFVRNQFIRCVPSCSAKNPIIYTYLENYPVNPFAASGNGGSGFPIKTGYPTTAEASAAIQSALNRPLGTLAGCNPANTDTVLVCSIQRIADVAFEWAPPPMNPTSSTRYGQTYAFLFNNDPVNGITETIGVPPNSLPVGKQTPNLATKTFNPPTNVGDPFPPNLDFLGFKEHPGVCFICHGGNPKNLTSTGAYPLQGNVSGFRYLPLDIRNLLFSSDSGGEQPALPASIAYTDRAHQEGQIMAYNLAVLQTVPSGAQKDAQGVTRVAHLREVISGWYAGGRTTQDVDFLPVGWREPQDGGTAPAGSEHLYETALSPSCRSCHFNRELSLDFGTAANLMSYKSDVLQYVVLPLCHSNNPQPGFRPMPLAHLTYQRFWQANQTAQSLPYPNSSEEPQLTLFNTAEQIANYFGYNGTAGYCATVH
jgi:hypothetical protein